MCSSQPPTVVIVRNALAYDGSGARPDRVVQVAGVGSVAARGGRGAISGSRCRRRSRKSVQLALQRFECVPTPMRSGRSGSRAVEQRLTGVSSRGRQSAGSDIRSRPIVVSTRKRVRITVGRGSRRATDVRACARTGRVAVTRRRLIEFVCNTALPLTKRRPCCRAPLVCFSGSTTTNTTLHSQTMGGRSVEDEETEAHERHATRMQHAIGTRCKTGQQNGIETKQIKIRTTPECGGGQRSAILSQTTITVVIASVFQIISWLKQANISGASTSHTIVPCSVGEECCA